MPFGLPLEAPIWHRLRRWRASPLIGYGTAAAAVLTAAGLRYLTADFFVQGVPFTLFYLAVVAATFAGGLGPGIAAVVGSALIAWLLFLPPFFAGYDLDYHQVVSVGAFAIVSSVLVALVTALSRAFDRLSLFSRNLQALLRHLPVGVLVADKAGKITYINQTLEEQFGYISSQLLGQPVEILVDEARRSHHRELREGYMRDPQPRWVMHGMGLKGRRKDGSALPIEVGLNPVEGDEEGRVFATVVDVSERARAEERQNLLVGELHHRAQNLLAVIDAVITRSLSGRKSVEEASEIISGRIRALSHSFAMLRGAGEASSLRTVIESELEPFGSRVPLVVDDIRLSPEAAQDFCLILHELATNAVKHGSLSVPSGKVRLQAKREGSTDAPRFVFDWREVDGPPVLRGQRKGFGSVVLEQTPRRFCDVIQAEFLPAGLHYRLEGPLSNLVA